MAAHGKHRDTHTEAILASYSHAASSPIMEYLYTHPGTAVVPWVLVIATALVGELLAAALLAVIVLLGLTLFGGWLTVHEASGNVTRIMREVVAREEDRA